MQKIRGLDFCVHGFSKFLKNLFCVFIYCLSSSMFCRVQLDPRKENDLTDKKNLDSYSQYGFYFLWNLSFFRNIKLHSCLCTVFSGVFSKKFEQCIFAYLVFITVPVRIFGLICKFRGNSNPPATSFPSTKFLLLNEPKVNIGGPRTIGGSSHGIDVGLGGIHRTYCIYIYLYFLEVGGG